MMTDPDWLPHLMNSKGAVTAYGGFLCHTAIVCRELGIPCVTGIGEDALEELCNQHEQIEVNGNNGNVKVLERKRTIQHKETYMKGGENMIKFLKKLFKKNSNVLINLNNVNKTLSMSMAGNGNCSDCC